MPDAQYADGGLINIKRDDALLHLLTSQMRDTWLLEMPSQPRALISHPPFGWTRLLHR